MGAIGICIPERFFAPWEFVESLLKLEGKYPIRTAKGSVIEDNRNWLFRRAKFAKNPWTIMIDSDMVFTPEDVDKLVAHLQDKDIVTGLYLRGSGNITPCLFDMNLEPINEVPHETFEVGACGGGFLAISQKVLETLTDPFVRFDVHSEDVAFCIKAREAGFKIWCDPSINLGHIRTNILKFVPED